MAMTPTAVPPPTGFPARRLALSVVVAVAAVAAVGVGTVHAASGAATGCPVGWTCQDIGPATPPGGQQGTTGTWRVSGGGADIWGTTDAFHFVWTTLAGDGTVGAQVVSQTDTDQNAKAGVMIRAGSGADSAFYDVVLTPRHGLATQFRTAAGQAATNAGGQSATTPRYVRILRSGSTFTAYSSGDGLSWAKVSGSTKTVPGLFGPLEAGLVVTSHHPSVAGTAVFTSVGVAPSVPTSAGPAAPTTTTTTTTTPTTTTTTAGVTTTTPAPPSGTGSGTPSGSGPGTGGTPPTGGGSGTAGTNPAGPVTVCGTSLCVDGSAWSMYGSTIYNPGLSPYQSGIKDPTGTVALAEQAHLDTIRITDFLAVTGDPTTAPYDPARWAYVDAMIAAAGAAGLHVDLGLSDYRAMLWNRCVDPYTAEWSPFLTFVANRVNTVSHVVYKDDPTIAFVSLAGEPLPVGTHQYTAKATGAPCTMTYSTADLTSFYAAGTSTWRQQGGTVLVNSGGLGYLNESTAGIDWQSIFSLPGNAFCAIKTYGGMQAWAPVAAAYCRSIGKPVVVEEFGWTQGVGDPARAQLFDAMVSQLRALHVAGLAFWNLGYQQGPTSYEVNPSTPDTFAAVVQNAP